MKRFKYIYHLFLSAITMFVSFIGCTDKDLTLRDENDENMIPIEGYSLGFTIQLDKDIDTRDGVFDSFKSNVETFENWIDTQDKFRVLFFTEDGDFIFWANDRVVGALKNVTDYTHNYWYVRIPMNMLVDRDNNEYDLTAIKNYLKNNKFKIAVLANWPNKGEKINPGDYDDSEENQNKTNPAKELKGEPLWGWENSVLNPNTTADKIKNINDLHHLFDETDIYDSSGKTEYYKPFMAQLSGESANGGNSTYWAMGQPSDWVKMCDTSEGWKADKHNISGVARYSLDPNVNTFGKKEEANTWIRTNWNPNVALNEAKQIYRHYQHLWYLWNFDAIYKTGLWIADNPRATSDQKVQAIQSYYRENFSNLQSDTERANETYTHEWGEEWWKRNGEGMLYNWMSSGSNYLSDKTTLIGDADGQAMFEYKYISGSKRTSVTSGGQTYYGIYLPNRGTSKTTSTSTGCIKFQARTAGTLRIVWSSATAGSSATLYMQKGTGGDGNKNSSTTSGTPVVYSADFSVGDESYPIWIYCSAGVGINIYSIEYIRGKYLYDTDRENITPGENQGIPMYGVQEYDPINSSDEEWVYGTTHNLSGNISMVRALAKVELYIPTVYGKPTHVYMRCLNRSARCEPIDVETNTGDLWLGTDTSDGSEAEGFNHGSNCEFFRILKRGAVYNNTTYDGDGKYQNWLAWFYGCWKFHTWQIANRKWETSQGKWVGATTNSGWKFDNNKYTPSGDKNDFPHLFNPYINRSDFARFLYAGEVEGMYKYVFYMPEKSVDDPTTVGEVTKTPKVPHIEYRFNVDSNETSAVNGKDYTNTEFNLDDGDCYRVYFTNYGSLPTNLYPLNTAIMGVEKTDYDNYEMNKLNGSTGSNANLHQKHWPILRNHKYQFYVSSQGPENPQVQVRVSNWGYEKVLIKW